MLDEAFLTLWRSRSRQTLIDGLNLDDLQARLLAVSPRQDTVADPLSVASQLSDGHAAMDLAMTWTLLAALQGERLAALDLAVALQYRARGFTFPQEVSEAGDRGVERPLEPSTLAADWLAAAADWPRLLDPFHRKRLQDRLETLNEASRPPQPQSRTQPDPLPGPSLVPVPHIMAGDSREGREISRQYGSLSAPHPLAGPRTPLETLEQVLHLEFPWLDDLIQALTDDLRLMRAGGLHWLQITPTVVVGPPSVGKTRFARRLAYLAGTGYAELSGAGMTDNRVLLGTSRGWSTAQPCLPLLTMMRTHTANPLIVFDELDKTGGSDRNGDTKETLLSMLERETAKAWPDPCLLAPADLSRVNWLFTANDIAHLPTVLRSRLRIVHVAAPGPEHFEPILIGILADVAADLMLRPQDLPPLPASSIRSLRHAFAEGTPIRAIKRAVRRVLARAPAHRLHH